MPYIFLAVRCIIMKRRTFLRLSSAALASLGLSACGAKSATSEIAAAVSNSVPLVPSVADSISSDNNDADLEDNISSGIGMTLETAKEFSSYSNRPYFIHRTNGLFYSVAITMEADSSFVAFLDYNALARYSQSNSLNLHLLDGDELVYISSSGSMPNSVSFSPINEIGNTIPSVLCVNKQGITSLVGLKQYRYQADISPNEAYDAPHHAGKNNNTYQYYYWTTFNSYDLANGPDKTMLFTDKHHVTLDGASIDDTITSLMGFDNLLQIAYPADFSTAKDEYLLREFNFASDEPLDSSRFYQYGLENPHKVEWYEGTTYHAFNLEPSCAYFVYDSSDSASCPISLTPNGYAVVDLTFLGNQSQSYILNCKEILGTPCHAYLFIQP